MRSLRCVARSRNAPLNHCEIQVERASSAYCLLIGDFCSSYDELASAAPADDPLDMRSPVYHCVTVPLMLAGHLLGLAQSILSQQGATSGTRKTEGMAAAEASQASLIELLLRWIWYEMAAFPLHAWIACFCD